MLALVLAVGIGATPPCSRVLLNAEVELGGRVVRGTITCIGGSPQAVATYPRLLRTPSGLDDVTRPWLYPAGFSAADMRLWAASGPLGGEGAWQTLPPTSGTDGPVAVRFETVVPERNGAFGRRDGTAYLLGGWHPSFGVPGEPLVPMLFDYDVRVPPGTVGFVGVQPFGVTSPRRRTGRFVGRFLPLLVAPALAVRVTADAVLLRPQLEPCRPPRHAPACLADVTAALDRTADDQLLETLTLGSDFAGRNGLVPSPLLVVVGPLRERLVERFDGGLLVSDRAFHIPALELFRKFHRLALWRTELASFVEPHTRRCEHELPSDLTADAAAAALRRELARERYGETRYAPELLEPFAVIPEIDNLIFAPQIPFVDAYFDAVDERGQRAARLDDFTHDLPRGKLVYEKLLDRLGPAAVAALVRAYLAGCSSFFDYVRARGGEEAVQGLRQFVGPPPRVNYTVASVRPMPAGFEVEVAATGPDASRLREPVTVAVTDDQGEQAEVVRLGPGPASFAGAYPPARVEIDPRGRLVELANPPGAGPRFDNRLPPRWRLLLNDISGLVAVTNRQVSVSADFSLRRLHDQRHRLDLRAGYSPEAYALGATWSYGHGLEVTPLRLARRTGVGLAGERLRVERGAGRPGFESSFTLFHTYDTRQSPYGAYEGSGFAARLTGAMGADHDARVYRYMRASASGLTLLPLGSYHSLAARLRADFVFGDPPPQQRLRLGGRYTAGRGYEPDEARAERRVVMSIEDRHALSVDTRTDLGGLLMVTGIEGAAFADAVYLPYTRPGCRRTVSFDVGYGVRFLLDVLDVSPSSVAIDVGVPLSRCPDEDRRAPVTVYLAFVQSFLVF